MKPQRATSLPDIDSNNVYLAGETVPPGTYYYVEGNRELRMDEEGTLPATFDGRVATYTLSSETWGEWQKRMNA